MKQSFFKIQLLFTVLALVGGACKKEAAKISKETSVPSVSSELSANRVGEPPAQRPLVIASEYSTFVIREDNSLWAAGNNQYGQLGDGTTTSRTVPVKIMDQVRYVAAGRYHTLILKMDSTLWVVGRNESGQLGLGNFNNQSSPIQIAINVRSIAAGDQHSLYTRTTYLRSVYTPILMGAGSNADGQLGCYDCGTGAVTRFTDLRNNVDDVVAGSNYTLVMSRYSPGIVMATGANNLGQLGDGTTTKRTAFKQMAENVMSMAAGKAHTLILKADGSLWATGYNGFGQLGDGTTIRKTNFTYVTDNVSRIAAGLNQSMFISADNSRVMYTMGSNTHGQLGINSTENKSLPVPISLFVNWINAGGYHSFYIKDDKTVMGAGYNAYGQLGNGNKQNQLFYVPTILR